MPDCGQLRADGEALRYEGDCAVTFLLAARTDYQMRYPDYRAAGVDPALSARSDINAAAKRTYPVLTQRHTADHAALYSRVQLELGAPVTKLPTDRLRATYGGGNVAVDRALEQLYFNYGRYLLMRLTRRVAARQSAGRVERQGDAALERGLPRQHQPADELLAGREREPRGDRDSVVRLRGQPGRTRKAGSAALLWRARMDDVSQHQRLGIRGPHRLAHGLLAAGGVRLAGATSLRALSIQPG